ncbi:kinase-like protein [Musa troglodytarum]|uniref:Kinase-like protein n=1 Tax=Musa troglodytarum TaxID=320322 RepID=A0A9E7KZ60_9LILI|nr:kinase-like protein [Musa troglodytarum]
MGEEKERRSNIEERRIMNPLNLMPVSTDRYWEPSQGKKHCAVGADLPPEMNWVYTGGEDGARSGVLIRGVRLREAFAASIPLTSSVPTISSPPLCSKNPIFWLLCNSSPQLLSSLHPKMASLPPKAAPFPLFSLLSCSSFFFFLCCFAVYFSFASSEPSSADVVLLLNKIKPALQGSAANAELSSWNVSFPLCLWRGLRWSAGGSAAEIRCEDDLALRSNLSLSSDPSLHLLSIRLPAAALAGSLPPELGLFSYLESLYLDVNSLTGPIPLELGNGPALSDLDLAGNALEGALPPSIWNLCDRLVSLRLHGNDLSGSVPDPAMPSSSCKKLKVLDLSDNRFQGSFPKFVSEFSGLEELDLSNNRFSGSITDSLAGLGKLVRLNLSYNNFTGPLPASFGESKFTAEAFQGNPGLCGPPLGKCGSGSGLSSGAIAGIVIGLLAGAVVLASVSIGWVQGGKRRNRVRKADEEADMVFEEDGNGGGDGKLIVFQGGEHLSLEDVLNATGQVMEKTSYGTVYKAKLADGGNISLRLLREGSCKDQAECSPVIRQLGRVRHENLTALRAFYQGKRGEKLLIYDYHPSRSLHDLLHDTRAGKPLLNWPRRHKIALGVARGLAHLHNGLETPITHGNVRSKNVHIDEYFVPRLTEFGLDKLMVPAVADEMVSAAKCDGYKAPELQKMKKCGSRTDVYAFGILLLEILMGRKPGKGTGEGADLPALVKVAVLEETTMEVFDVEVLKGTRSPMEDGLVQALKLAMGCCAPAAAARPDMNEVVKLLEESRPRNRSALYTPTDRSEIGTPF